MRILVGLGSCGIAAGASDVYVALEIALKKCGIVGKPLITGCLGTCYLEPIVEVVDDRGEKYTYVNVTPETAAEIVEKHIKGGAPIPELMMPDEAFRIIAMQTRIALRNCGIINPEDIEEYTARGGYKAIKHAVTMLRPEKIIGILKESGLRGCGGAGFPTWVKWNTAANSQGDVKYMVCNADEGDPGAFMDRVLMESDPHSVLEGMLIGGYAIGAAEGIIYVRAEYPLAMARLSIAIKQAREAGILGRNLYGSEFCFDIRVKEGAGSYVCGEETALIASLEGWRGAPRLKPPYPAERGYRGRPTVINNVETLAYVPWIITNGSASFSVMGTERSRGTKVFALSGKIKKGGLVEIPMGLTLREIVYDIGGGVKDGRKLKAVQIGGPFSASIPASLIDTPVTHEDITAVGATVGSGGIIVMDDTACMVDMARFSLAFIEKESCGKCGSCRILVKKMSGILDRIVTGKGRDGDIELLEELSARAKDGSICAFGQTAANPVLTTLKHFRNEYEDHIYKKKCTANSCRPMHTYE